MKSKQGKIIYIGKAKNLKKRVVSYFRKNANVTFKTQLLLEAVFDFDFIVTRNEVEAFVLENNLIKKHRPKYNIQFKDDKSYPYVVIDHDEPFAQIKFMRRPKRKKSRDVFGPFVTGSNLMHVLSVLRKCFQLRDCSLHEFNNRKRACLLYQIDQCSAPCVGEITQEDYYQDLKMAMSFFKGNAKEAIEILNNRMWQYAEDELFEKATVLRDQIKTLEEFIGHHTSQLTEINKDANYDFFATHVNENSIDLSIYVMRCGLLLGFDHRHIALEQGDQKEDMTSQVISTLLDIYQQHLNPPDFIWCDLNDHHRLLLEKSLLTLVSEEKNQIKKAIKVKEINSNYRPLLQMCLKHAKEMAELRSKNDAHIHDALMELKQIARLKKYPRYIECFDVAVLQGESPAGSKVVTFDGRPLKKDYRYYKLTQLERGNDDFFHMRELLDRRVKQMKEDDFYPDLLVIDGGQPQLRVARQVLLDHDVSVAFIGLAKEREIKKAEQKNNLHYEERLVLDGQSNTISLKRHPDVSKILTRLRDEAHRFCRRLHHKHESKRLLKSWLDPIEGIGPKRKQKILELTSGPNFFVEKETSSIVKLLGIPTSLAKRLKEEAKKVVQKKTQPN